VRAISGVLHDRAGFAAIVNRINPYRYDTASARTVRRILQLADTQ
jgi:hypothetical protein